MKSKLILCLALGLTIFPGVSFADAPPPPNNPDSPGGPLTDNGGTSGWPMRLAATGSTLFVASYIDFESPTNVGIYTTSGEAVNPSIASRPDMTLDGPHDIVLSGSHLLVFSRSDFETATIDEYDATGVKIGEHSTPDRNLNIDVAAMAVSGSNLFVASIYRSDQYGQPKRARIRLQTTSGDIVKPSLISGLHDPSSLNISGDKLFVADRKTGTIGEYTTSGKTVNATLVSGLQEPSSLAISEDKLFVANEKTGTIGEYSTSGETVNASLIQGLQKPCSIAVSGNDLFVANATTGTIGKYTTSGETVNPTLLDLSRHFDFKVGIELSQPNIHFKFDPVSDFFKFNARSVFVTIGGPLDLPSVTVKIRLENPTAVDQSTREAFLWPDSWKSSNPRIFWPEPWSFDGAVGAIVKIPADGAITHELVVYLDNKQPILRNKISFRLGYHPGFTPQRFWSNEVVLRVVDDTPYFAIFFEIVGLILGAIFGITIVWWAARWVFQRGKPVARIEYE